MTEATARITNTMFNMVLIRSVPMFDYLMSFSFNAVTTSSGSGTIPPNPSELLGSHAMEDLLNEVSDTFDYIVIDTSPILPVTDALILAAKSDATIIVGGGDTISAVNKYVKENKFIISLVVTATVASLTISGKAIGKSYAINKSNLILYKFSKSVSA